MSEGEKFALRATGAMYVVVAAVAYSDTGSLLLMSALMSVAAFLIGVAGFRR